LYEILDSFGIIEFNWLCSMQGHNFALVI